jgi:replicative DNA helicase|tara:strand:+ start:2263 stop:3636 length:1374 start_codon:yes stop_codon:yes gene_type:complete
MKFEQKILSNLIFDGDYMRKVIPFIKDNYFDVLSERIIFTEINEYVIKYDDLPTKSVLEIQVQNRNDLSEEVFKECMTCIRDLHEEKTDENWLIDTTEKWCKERAVYLALMESIKIADGKDKTKSRDAIPSVLSEALSVSFDDHVGHDYFNDADSRYDFYHRKEDKIEFDLDMFNKITKGGLPRKTLNIALAGTGVGKSLFMCHQAASCLLQGQNVLYITLEMAEERIAERIDANLFNMDIKTLVDLPKPMYDTKVNKLVNKTRGRLIIKEYPTASAHAGHFKSLLNELSLKKGFSPDIIFIDYLNICSSSRFKGTIVNSYTFVKAIAEELRGLAVEYDVPIVSATQTTRTGYGSSDVELTDTSESFGLPATADFMFALISTEELEEMNQLMVKQLKNRYNDPTMNKRFVIGIDRAKMKLYNLEDSAQMNIVDSGQEEEDYTDRLDKKFRNFDGFKV